MRAAHSSSALAVNTFGRWISEPRSLTVLGLTRFLRIGFEVPCKTGLGGTPPHLDVVAESDSEIVAIESKCLEYLRPHKVEFSESYGRISDFRSGTAWFRQIRELANNPLRYKYLDAAQLTKHYLGLSRKFPDRRVTLLYLFWEPKNPQSTPDFQRHRDEIGDFRQAVAGSPVTLLAMSYPELWTSWTQMRGPSWIRDHVKNLRARYEVPIQLVAGDLP